MKKIYELDFDSETADMASLRQEEFQLDHADEICTAIQEFDSVLRDLLKYEALATMEAYSISSEDLDGLDKARKLLRSVFEGNGIDIDQLTY